MIIKHLDGTIENIDQTIVNKELKQYKLGDVIKADYANDQNEYIVINIIHIAQDNYSIQCLKCKSSKLFNKIVSVKLLHDNTEFAVQSYNINYDTADNKFPEVIGNVKRIKTS